MVRLGQHLAQTDLLILSIRFANLEPSQHQALDEYLTNKPFIAIRTTTHLFQFPKDSELASENRAFPTRHFGTPYRGHHGHDTSQANYVMAAKHPVMTGIEPRFWTPDFHYAVNPLSIESTPLMIGQALEGRQPATFKNVSSHNHTKVLSAKDENRLRGSPHPLRRRRPSPSRSQANCSRRGVATARATRWPRPRRRPRSTFSRTRKPSKRRLTTS